MDHPAIAVLTSQSLEQILAEGGSSSWVLNQREAQRLPYLVCAHNSKRSGSGAFERHGSAFLVGRVQGFEPLQVQNGFRRWRINLSEYAAVDTAWTWPSWRNPVRYTTLEELRIDPDLLSFAPVNARQTNRPADAAGMSIAEAKAGLSARFGVPESAIEITIRA